MLDIECVVPNIAQQYKSIQDGGARVVFELDPVSALLYHTWMMKQSDIYCSVVRLTLEVIIPEPF